MRTSNGCWTCRLRRKKCDENKPTCQNCQALLISCDFSVEKPTWMDGGAQQDQMLEQLKREIKKKSHERRGAHAVVSHSSHGNNSVSSANDLYYDPVRDESEDTTVQDGAANVQAAAAAAASPPAETHSGSQCTLPTQNNMRDGMTFAHNDSVLMVFYLDQLIPFLFPFYRPSILQGGKAWILKMMLLSPVVRQATLCHSSYFLSLLQARIRREVAWDAVLAQTSYAFDMLGQSLQVINRSGILDHLHGAVRILTSIMQVQRFEVAVSSFDSCQAHLSAAVALFKQLLDSMAATEDGTAGASTRALLRRLGEGNSTPISPCLRELTAEQAAFRFSSALLILDDIVASTVLREKPSLHAYHRGLLERVDGVDPTIDLEAVVGCENWVLLHIGETAALDAWKQECKRAGDLDVMQMARHATVIKDSLHAHLSRFDEAPDASLQTGNSLVDAFNVGFGPDDHIPTNKTLITRIWAHAAYLHLHVVVSGWQPASLEVRRHVDQILYLLTRHLSPPHLLRTVVWPFCVAGLLAQQEQEPSFRVLAEALQPPSVFGTVRKALEIMEATWRNRNTYDFATRDLASCFRSQGELILLV